MIVKVFELSLSFASEVKLLQYNELCGNLVSKMGMGFMRYNSNNYKEIENAIDYSIKNGVNYFESCYFYLDNKCESLLSKALSKYPRSTYYLCGKMPVHGVLESGKTPEMIFDEQLNNCQTSYFDYYLIQAVDKRVFEIIEKHDLINFLNKKREQGFIKNLGFSFHDTPDVLEEFIQKNNWDLIQLQLNYFDWYISTGKQNYEICKKYNIPIVVMGGLKGGTITDRLPKKAKDILCVDNIKPYEYAYKFLTTLSGVKVILNGSSRFDELKYNIDFFSNQENFILKKNQLDKILKTVDIIRKSSIIDCHNCGYCMPKCPKNIDVKDIFTLYNKIMIDKDDKDSLFEYVKIQKGRYSSFNCIKCGNCEKICPQHLKIRDIFNNKIFQLRM